MIKSNPIIMNGVMLANCHVSSVHDPLSHDSVCCNEPVRPKLDFGKGGTGSSESYILKCSSGFQVKIEHHKDVISQNCRGKLTILCKIHQNGRRGGMIYCEDP